MLFLAMLRGSNEVESGAQIRIVQFRASTSSSNIILDINTGELASHADQLDSRSREYI